MAEIAGDVLVLSKMDWVFLNLKPWLMKDEAKDVISKELI